MAKEYFAKLSNLLDDLKLAEDVSAPLEIKHFFSGAALYHNGVMCASWSPVGLAFKLSEQEVSYLIANGQAKPLKYFPKGHVKKGYALFDDPESTKTSDWKKYFLMAVEQAK